MWIWFFNFSSFGISIRCKYLFSLVWVRIRYGFGMHRLFIQQATLFNQGMHDNRSSSRRVARCLESTAPATIYDTSAQTNHIFLFSSFRHSLMCYWLLFLSNVSISFVRFARALAGCIYVWILITVAAAAGRRRRCQWETLCDAPHDEWSNWARTLTSHTQRRRCRRWNWYIQQISGNENVVCANWFCTNRLALKALHAARFFFLLLGISFLFIFHVFVHSHVLRCLFGSVNRLSSFGSCVRGFVFRHTFCSLSGIRSYRFTVHDSHRHSTFGCTEIGIFRQNEFSSIAESNFQWGNKTGISPHVKVENCR